MNCTQCGTQNPENGTFCVGCGQALQAAAAQPQYAAAPAAAPEVNADEAKDAADNKTMGILSYILFFIPLITGDAQKSPFVKFHCNQGLVLAIAGVLSSIIAVIPIIGWILAPVLGIAVFVFDIMGIIAAVKGEKKDLPLVSKLKILK